MSGHREERNNKCEEHLGSVTGDRSERTPASAADICKFHSRGTTVDMAET